MSVGLLTRSMLTCAALLAALALAACGDDDDDDGGDGGGGGGGGERVGAVIKGLDNPFFAAMNDGLEAAGEQYGADLEVQAAASLDDTAGQASKLEALTAQGYDCYVINPISESNLVQPLARVQDTPIVNIDLPIGKGPAAEAELDIATYIGTDNVAAGRLGAESMAKAVEQGGTVGVIGGISGDPTSAARIDGFRQAAEGKFTALDTVAADWDRAEALTRAEEVMRSNPDLTGFFAANDQMALGIAQAVRNAGKSGDISIVGVDGIEDALAAVERGSMLATVSQYPYTIGQLGLEACLAAADGKTLPKQVDAPVQVVTSENAERAQQNFPEPVEPFDDPFAKMLER